MGGRPGSARGRRTWTCLKARQGTRGSPSGSREFPGDAWRPPPRELAPHAIAFYLRALAGEFHSYYNAERILVEDETLRAARLALCAAVRQTLANGLALLGVSAPEKM